MLTVIEHFDATLQVTHLSNRWVILPLFQAGLGSNVIKDMKTFDPEARAMLLRDQNIINIFTRSDFNKDFTPDLCDLIEGLNDRPDLQEQILGTVFKISMRNKGYGDFISRIERNVGTSVRPKPHTPSSPEPP